MRWLLFVRFLTASFATLSMSGLEGAVEAGFSLQHASAPDGGGVTKRRVTTAEMAVLLLDVAVVETVCSAGHMSGKQSG